MLHDSEGADAYAVLLADESDEDLAARVKGSPEYAGIKLARIFSRLWGNSMPTPAYYHAEEPRVILARMNVQGFADGAGTLQSVYAVRVIERIDITTKAHEAAAGLALLALDEFRKVRKDPSANFGGRTARALDMKAQWIRGEAEPSYMVDLYHAATADVDQLMWYRGGSRTTYTDPITHAWGCVSSLAAYCLLTNAGNTLHEVVLSLSNVVSVEFSVRQLAERNIRTGWDEIEEPTELKWDVEGVLRKHLLPARAKRAAVVTRGRQR